MYARDILETEVREVLETGEMLEEYPEAAPNSTRLLLGLTNERTLHVVAAYPVPGMILVITVYEPDPARWKPGFRKRK